MEPIERTPGSWIRPLTQFLIIALLVLLFIALLGALIFVLHRIALADRRLYSALFLLALAGFLAFLAVRAVRRRTFVKAAVKILRILYVLLVGAAAAAVVLAYGALAVRHPLLGAACLPPLAIAVYMAGKQGRLFERIKKFYRKLN